MNSFDGNPIYEKLREKVFFYVTYQRRTASEVKRTFLPAFKKYNIPEEILEDLVEELKEKGHIDDKDFVKKKFKAYVSFNNLLSVKEITNKMLQKGVSKDLIDEYIEQNRGQLYEHEVKAAKKLYEKKIAEKSDEEVKRYLLRKGYNEDIVDSL